jgi:hypothetical protein
MKMCKVDLKEQSIYIRLQKRMKTKSSPMSVKINVTKKYLRMVILQYDYLVLFINDLKLHAYCKISLAEL